MLGQKWRPEHDDTLRQIALNLTRRTLRNLESWITLQIFEWCEEFCL